jgi:hypothetical protein
MNPKHAIEIIDALNKVITEWERQKRLFPILSTDGWMDAAVENARVTLSLTTTPTKER